MKGELCCHQLLPASVVHITRAKNLTFLAVSSTNSILEDTKIFWFKKPEHPSLQISGKVFLPKESQNDLVFVLRWKKTRCVRRIPIITNPIRHRSPPSQSICWEVQGLSSDTAMLWFCKLSFMSIIKLAHHCGGNHYFFGNYTMSQLGHGLCKVLLENPVKIRWYKINISFWFKGEHCGRGTNL